MKLNELSLQETLDILANKYNVKEFIGNDPVQFPRRFSALQDIEISGLLTVIISWGRRDMILRNADKMHETMNNEPYNFIMNKEWESLDGNRYNIHRTFFSDHLYILCKNLHTFYQNNESLESLFCENTILEGLDRLSKMLSSSHVASPKSGSPCKRSNLFLRWMIRNDNIVDLGIWRKVSPSSLIIPLDTHVAKTARILWDDLPKTDRLTTAVKITEHLRELSPDDPCKYDFALFGYGEEKSKQKSIL